MPIAVVTRFRARSVRFLLPFAWYARKTLKQAETAQGFLSGAVVPERGFVFWTITVWEDEASMGAFVGSGVHRRVMPKIMDWADEASAVRWHQSHSCLPEFSQAALEMQTKGRPFALRHPSVHHEKMSFRIPAKIAIKVFGPKKSGNKNALKQWL